MSRPVAAVEAGGCSRRAGTGRPEPRRAGGNQPACWTSSAATGPAPHARNAKLRRPAAPGAAFTPAVDPGADPRAAPAPPWPWLAALARTAAPRMPGRPCPPPPAPRPGDGARGVAREVNLDLRRARARASSPVAWAQQIEEAQGEMKVSADELALLRGKEQDKAQKLKDAKAGLKAAEAAQRAKKAELQEREAEAEGHGCPRVGARHRFSLLLLGGAATRGWHFFPHEQQHHPPTPLPQPACGGPLARRR